MDLVLFETDKDFSTNKYIIELLNDRFNCIIQNFEIHSNYFVRILRAFKLVSKNLSNRKTHQLVFQFPPKLEEIPTILFFQHFGNQPIAIVHDLDNLRGIRNRGLLLFFDPSGFRILRKSKVIVHSGKMDDYLKSKRINSMGRIKVWPHSIKSRNDDKKTEVNHAMSDGYHEPNIIYMGNLDNTKTKFLSKLNEKSPVITVFGQNYIPPQKSMVTFGGSFDDHSPPTCAPFTYGLIWDGDSIDKLSGVYGEYHRYNMPAKLSLYLAMNIPVIVSANSGIASLVEDLNIGICVDSINSISKIMPNSSWLNYVENIGQLSEEVKTGKTLIESIRKLSSKY